MAARILAFPYKEKSFRYILQNGNPTPKWNPFTTTLSNCCRNMTSCCMACSRK
jgi:hypothetical protein